MAIISFISEVIMNLIDHILCGHILIQNFQSKITRFWSMEELAAQFIQCFNALRTNDNNAVGQATNLIKQLSKNENAVSVLIIIIQQNEDPFIRFQASIAIKYCFRGINDESFNPENLINTLLQILANETENLIRAYLAHVIGETLIKKPTIPLAINFAHSALQSGQQIQIHSAIQLLEYLIGKYQNNDDQLAQFVEQLSLAAINFNNIQITLDTFEFYFGFTNEHHNIPSETSNNLWSMMISLLDKYVDDSQNFWSLAKIIGDCVDSDAVYADVEPLLPICFQLLTRDDLDHLQNHVIYMLDAIIINFPDQVLSKNMVIPIFQRYFQITLKDYMPNEQLDLLEKNDIFKNMCESFSSEDSFVISVWGTIKEFPQNDQGRYISMCILRYLFDPEVEYFDEILDDVVSLINLSLTSESTATMEAAIECLYEFLKMFSIVDDYLTSFETTILGIMKVRPTLRLIEAFTAVIGNVESTDNIFEEAFPILFYLISNSSPEANITLIHSLSILSLHSYVGVLSHYQTIITLMQNLLSNESEGIEFMKNDAIECINSLMRVSPDHFRPGLESFLPLILNLLHSKYYCLIAASINCIGNIVDLYPEDVKSLAPQLLDEMANYALNDSLPILQEITELFKQGYSVDEVNEEYGENTVDKDSLEISGGAFMVYASILAKFPELLPQNFERAVKIIQVLSVSIFSTHAVCFGVEIMMPAVKQIGFNVPELMVSILTNLRIIIAQASSTETIAEAVQAIAVLIHAVGFASLGNEIMNFSGDVINIFKFSLKCFEVSQKVLPENLYPSLFTLFHILFDNFSAEICSEFMKEIIPEILALTAKTKKEKAFALDVLVDYAVHGFNPTEDFIPNIFNLAIECIRNNLSSGFIAIDKLSAFQPDILRANAKNLLDLYMQKLTLKPKKSQYNYQAMIDNCISSLGSLAMQVLGDDFPLETFGKIVLSKLPPKQDYEECLQSYNFVLWMIPKSIQYLKADIIAALARLFGLSPKIIQRMNIDPESYQNFKQTFIKLLQISEDGEQICNAAVENDPSKIQYIHNAISS